MNRGDLAESRVRPYFTYILTICRDFQFGNLAMWTWRAAADGMCYTDTSLFRRRRGSVVRSVVGEKRKNRCRNLTCSGKRSADEVKYLMSKADKTCMHEHLRQEAESYKTFSEFLLPGTEPGVLLIKRFPARLSSAWFYFVACCGNRLTGNRHRTSDCVNVFLFLTHDGRLCPRRRVMC